MKQRFKAFFTLEVTGEEPSFFGRLFGKKAPVETFNLKFPSKIERQVQGQILEMTVTDIEINTGLEASRFHID